MKKSEETIKKVLGEKVKKKKKNKTAIGMRWSKSKAGRRYAQEVMGRSKRAYEHKDGDGEILPTINEDFS